MDWLSKLRECFDTDLVYYTRHARAEMEEDEFGQVSDEEVYEAVASGEILNEYPDDTPFPSVLVFGLTAQGRALHVVCAYDANERRAYVVTVYRPDPERWIDYRTRKTI